MSASPRKPWKVSLHGGHSVDYCGHAFSTLDELIEEAIAQGYTTYGLTEHAPRYEAAHLYQDEHDKGWTLQTLKEKFEAYAERISGLPEQYEGRIALLRAFEAEIVPEENYVATMNTLREEHEFDYIVGSVHWVKGEAIDYSLERFKHAVALCGQEEALAIRYYESLAAMVSALRPEVVGHFDLIRKYADPAVLAQSAVVNSARQALEVIRDRGCILDINLAGFRKGVGMPYLTDWQAQMVKDLSIPCCFGDDSHHTDHIGREIQQGRAFLLRHGIQTITVLTRDVSGIGRCEAPLE